MYFSISSPSIDGAKNFFIEPIEKKIIIFADKIYVVSMGNFLANFKQEHIVDLGEFENKKDFRILQATDGAGNGDLTTKEPNSGTETGTGDSTTTPTSDTQGDTNTDNTDTADSPKTSNPSSTTDQTHQNDVPSGDNSDQTSVPSNDSPNTDTNAEDTSTPTPVQVDTSNAPNFSAQISLFKPQTFEYITPFRIRSKDMNFKEIQHFSVTGDFKDWTGLPIVYNIFVVKSSVLILEESNNVHLLFDFGTVLKPEDKVISSKNIFLFVDISVEFEHSLFVKLSFLPKDISI